MRSEGYSSRAVCVSVCLLSDISPLERLFVLKTLSHTQRATKVKFFWGNFVKLLRSKVMPSFTYISNIHNLTSLFGRSRPL